MWHFAAEGRDRIGFPNLVDTVAHDILINKRQRANLSGTMLNWFRSLLLDRDYNKNNLATVNRKDQDQLYCSSRLDS